MLVRRLLLLAAVLLLIAAAAASLVPQEEAVVPPPSADEVRSDVELVEATISAQEEGQSIAARAGDQIRFEVSGDVLDSVQIERLDRIDVIDPTTPARFDLIVDEPGVYPIRLVEADRRIGRLDVKP